MNVLVDTSVWVEHFRKGKPALSELLGLDRVLTHPMVMVEIACGTPPAPRRQVLDNLALLRLCQQAALGEVLAFIERERLFGLGCGLVDMVLLASTLMTPGTELWTLDRRLDALAGRMNVAHRPSQP